MIKQKYDIDFHDKLFCEGTLKTVSHNFFSVFFGVSGGKIDWKDSQYEICIYYTEEITEKDTKGVRRVAEFILNDNEIFTVLNDLVLYLIVDIKRKFPDIKNRVQIVEVVEEKLKSIISKKDIRDLIS